MQVAPDSKRYLKIGFSCAQRTSETSFRRLQDTQNPYWPPYLVRRPVLREVPDAASGNLRRLQLLGLYLKGVRLEAGLTIEEIGKRLNGLAPAELQAICAAAKRMAFNRIANCDQLPPLSWSVFERATERVRGDVAQLDNTGFQ